MPAGKLPYNLAGLAEVTLDHAPKRWSAERCRNSLAKVMSALQVTCILSHWSGVGMLILVRDQA